VREKIMVKRIPLADVQEGMVLARAIANDKGMILCAEGTSLTEGLIQRFEQMAITDIYIENEEPLSQEEYSALKQEIEHRFALSQNSSSLLGKLKTVLLKRLESQKGSL
jgi:hypothetical protein